MANDSAGIQGAQIVVDGVGKRYGRHTALESVTTTFDPGQRVGIVGESGSGKSTLARLVMGLERPTSGAIVVDGLELGQRLATPSGRRDYWRRVQLVQQDTASSFNPRFTFARALSVPAQRLLGLDLRAAETEAARVVDAVGLPDRLLEARPAQLSGGQRQRMALARALVVRPSVLVCDEAVSALDVSAQGRVLNLVKTYAVETGATLVFISHGLPATAFVSEEMVVMYRGRLVERGDTDTLMAAPTDDYTAGLVASYRELAAT
ncbi:ATP-binding cassette domain-containing protein [Nocardioides sp. C4-1]|uniref:ABC transporter ATP-binding protein n=1 Tax=Nocardioides sp. C4-1 TaxID=3151851 RepID=UPI0032651DBC